MNPKKQRQSAKRFAENWKGRGYEKGDAQVFWTELLQQVCGMQSVSSKASFERRAANGGFIDCLIPDSRVIIEQKGLGIDLDKPEERQGRMVTPFEQAFNYAKGFKIDQQPLFIIVCNFETFRVHNRKVSSDAELEQSYIEFSLEELGENPSLLSFITDPENSRAEKERQVSMQAGAQIGELFELLRGQYIDPDSAESAHSLNVLCVRLVFCLFCEDADLFTKDALLNYLRNVPAENIRRALRELFAALNTPEDERDPYDREKFSGFPYVNGGLFAEDVEIPNFTEDIKFKLLFNASQQTDWSKISPTIFGGIFESTLNPETRRSGGMHYTSPENIHKVIDPLFLDALYDEFDGIKSNSSLVGKKKKRALQAFCEKLAGLRFLDPACGSGNFLTETYLCLRRLENEVLNEMNDGQTELLMEDDPSKNSRVSLSQFYGIEINDFACRVAKTALWIAQLQANNECEMLLDLSINDFPLIDSANIVHANAISYDWNKLIPASRCTYIMGNPPFNGARTMEPEQKEEIREVAFEVRNNHDLDYVAGWYVKTADMMDENPEILASLVSTNSICQGAQAADLWSYLMNKRGLSIDFAWRTFVWDSEATSKAHVHCVIVGFSKTNYATKVLFNESGESLEIENINAYLLAAPNIFVEDRKTPICGVPKMANGNQPRDGGNLILTAEERTEVLAKEPDLERFIRPYMGSEEFIKGKIRYCLWLEDATTEDIAGSDILRSRVKAVFDFRTASKAKTTNGYAKTPALFAQRPQKQGVDFLMVPRVSSERRFYLPIGYMDKSVVASDAAQVISDASLFHFGILTSQFHNAWIRAVAGRLKSDYRYSKEIVYNCFPWPECDDACKKAIENRAQEVLDARMKYSNAAPKDLYDPENAFLYPDLIAAHKSLDKAVEQAYGVEFNGDEEKIVAHLFRMYGVAINGADGD